MTSPRTALGIANLKFKVKHEHYYTLALVMANRQLGRIILRMCFPFLLMGDTIAEE
jgi:hypothetical protein